MRQTVTSSEAPAAIGPYSQAVMVGEWLFLSGQIPLNPKSGEVVVESIESATTQVMENLAAVLAAAGLTFDHVVKTTIYMTDLNDFGRVNAVYGKYFPANPPARATVQVAALPRGVPVEIDAIAHKNTSKYSGL
jgi:2-iminobutanoate/2-iminopropanoate deaminase